ncbi:hypothetical protein ID866_12871, partial [Astraeus odoratus]
MSSPHCTPSPHEVLLAKTMDAHQCTEAKWCLISEGELDPVLSDNKHMAKMRGWEKKWRVEVWKEEHRWRQDEAEKRAWEEAANKAQEEAERKVVEECKAQEEAVRAQEEAERLAKEAAEREEAAKRAAEAVEERADAKRRAIKECLWEAAGCRVSGVQNPCTRCHNKGTPCMLSAAEGKTTACKACHHAKVSCSWTKKTAGELRKWKWAWKSEEAEEIEVVEVDKDEDEEQLHFAVPQHLAEEHRDTLGALTTTLDTLSMDFLEFWQDSWNLRVTMLWAIETITDELQRVNDLKEEEMGRSKGKGKEKAQEEFRRARM